MKLDIPKFIDGLGDWLKDQMAPVLKRLEEVEARPLPQDGKDGLHGKDGENGKDGRDGVNGVDGKSVTPDEIESIVQRRVEEVMKSITLPKDGAPGRDALDLEIRPEIEEDKSYPRGTYAKHAGGLWRAYETTKGMRGWECIVNGVAEIAYDANPAEPRVISLKAVLSDGQEKGMSIYIPAMVYKGVFREDETYSAGDTVTWGGSLWHCDTATRDKPGELGVKSWTLAAKRGRDGKDGKDGKDITKGVDLK